MQKNNKFKTFIPLCGTTNICINTILNKIKFIEVLFVFFIRLYMLFCLVLINILGFWLPKHKIDNLLFTLWLNPQLLCNFYVFILSYSLTLFLGLAYDELFEQWNLVNKNIDFLKLDDKIVQPVLLVHNEPVIFKPFRYLWNWLFSYNTSENNSQNTNSIKKLSENSNLSKQLVMSPSEKTSAFLLSQNASLNSEIIVTKSLIKSDKSSCGLKSLLEIDAFDDLKSVIYSRRIFRQEASSSDAVGVILNNSNYVISSVQDPLDIFVFTNSIWEDIVLNLEQVFKLTNKNLQIASIPRNINLEWLNVVIQDFNDSLKSEQLTRETKDSIIRYLDKIKSFKSQLIVTECQIFQDLSESSIKTSYRRQDIISSSEGLEKTSAYVDFEKLSDSVESLSEDQISTASDNSYIQAIEDLNGKLYSWEIICANIRDAYSSIGKSLPKNLNNDEMDLESLRFIMLELSTLVDNNNFNDKQRKNIFHILDTIKLHLHESFPEYYDQNIDEDISDVTF